MENASEIIETGKGNMQGGSLGRKSKRGEKKKGRKRKRIANPVIPTSPPT